MYDLPEASSHSELIKIADTAIEVRRALTLHGYNLVEMDFAFTSIFIRKLDPITLAQWLVVQDPQKPPLAEEMIIFMEKHSSAGGVNNH